MADLTLRSAVGRPLTNSEVDANFSALNLELAQKLAQSGGTLSGDLQLAGNALRFYQLGVRSWGASAIGGNLDITAGDLGGALRINGYTALHAGNYSSYALPLSGGTLSGSLNVATNAASMSQIYLQNADTAGTGYSTQTYFRLGVGGVVVGGLKTTLTPLIGLSTKALYLTTEGAFPIAFGTGNSATPSMLLGTSGNLGLGVTPSAWSSTYKAVQLGSAAFMGRAAGSDAYFLANSYLDSAGNWAYYNTAAAGLYAINAGAHSWHTAPSGTAGATTTITSGQVYTVTTLSSTTLAQWQAFFSGLAALPTVGQSITATATGTLLGGATVTQKITFTQAMTLSSTGLDVLNAIKQGGNQVLHAGNYNNYAAPVTHYHDRIYNGASGSSYYLALSSGNEVELYDAAGNIAPMYLQYSGAAGSLRGPGGNIVLHAGNYSSYAPTLTGGGASGTWAINISGNAGYASNANTAETANYANTAGVASTAAAAGFAGSTTGLKFDNVVSLGSFLPQTTTTGMGLCITGTGPSPVANFEPIVKQITSTDASVTITETSPGVWDLAAVGGGGGGGAGWYTLHSQALGNYSTSMAMPGSWTNAPVGALGELFIGASSSDAFGWGNNLIGPTWSSGTSYGGGFSPNGPYYSGYPSWSSIVDPIAIWSGTPSQGFSFVYLQYPPQSTNTQYFNIWGSPYGWANGYGGFFSTYSGALSGTTRVYYLVLMLQGNVAVTANGALFGTSLETAYDSWSNYTYVFFKCDDDASVNNLLMGGTAVNFSSPVSYLGHAWYEYS